MPSDPPRSAAGGASKVAAAPPAPPAPKTGDAIPAANRKKQKKRQNQAGRRTSEQQLPSNAAGGTAGVYGNGPIAADPHDHRAAAENQANGVPDMESYDSREADVFYSDEESHAMAPLPRTAGAKKKKKKSKSKAAPVIDDHDPYATQQMPGSFHPPPPPPPPPPPTDNPAADPARKMSRDRIWNTSTSEERERIKEFWLSLEESQRRSLVKVEKEAVLKKMKEQQRNSCSCTVCGRKRTAIEEELEVLYDAYYEELEQPKGRIMEEIDDDEDDEPYSDDDYDDESYDSKGSAADFFNFGNSLTVKGGILTVADDLLKNDGKKFIEMMEQLAERRMAREKTAHVARWDPSPTRHPHDHSLDDEEEYDDDDDVEYEDDPDEEYDEDMEAMSEEQRMEEGRRMFQIFAARMFEQRVLTAYREKVAKERQEKLLEELADESRLDAQREAKRAREAQKKKDRKKQQKAAKEEERLKREAEKAAEEAAIKAAEEKRLEEVRLKKEEQRKKKEAERQAQDEERLRKETEKARRAQELKEQQAEAERKQREQREKDRKKKEEQKKKEREERDAREREIRERKEKDMAEKRERDAKAKAEREAKAKTKKDESKGSTQPVPAVPPLPRKPSAIVPPVPSSLQASGSNHASPHLPVATPAVPKSTSSGKPRQASTSEVQQVSPKPVSTQSGSAATSPGSAQYYATSSTTSFSSKLPPITSSQAPGHIQAPPTGLPPGMPPYPYGSPPGLPNHGFPNNYGQNVPAGMSRASPQEPPGFGPQFGALHRGYQSPAGLGFPPGINGLRGMPQGRGSPAELPGSQGPIGGSNPSNAWAPSTSSHSRQASYEKHGHDVLPAAPGTIGRPAPIQRPSSIPHPDEQNEVDELSRHLGSSALLDDDDGPAMGAHSVRGMAPGAPRPTQIGYGASAFPGPIGPGKMENFSSRQPPSSSTWGGQPGAPMHSGTWNAAPSTGWGGVPSHFAPGPARSQSRPIALRLMACQACRQLTSNGAAKSMNGFFHIDHIVRVIDQLRPANDPPVHKDELLDILDTEGNSQNGGGNFAFQNLAQGTFVKYEMDGYAPRAPGAPGEIGSPIGNASMQFGRGFAPPTQSGF